MTEINKSNVLRNIFKFIKIVIERIAKTILPSNVSQYWKDNKTSKKREYFEFN